MICLFVHHSHTVFTNVVTYELGSVSPPALFFFNVVLVILGHYISLWISVILCQFLQKCQLRIWLQWIYKSICHLMLKLKMHEHGMSVHLFVFFNFCQQCFTVFRYKTCTSSVKFVPKRLFSFWSCCEWNFLNFIFGLFIALHETLFDGHSQPFPVKC